MAGQGWGINPEWDGMRGFDAVRLREPDFFIHSGDTFYADVPIKSEVTLPDGTVWKNVVTEAKSKVAETLDEFRGNFRYNLSDGRGETGKPLRTVPGPLRGVKIALRH